jgi:hypothetical protein
MRGDVSGICFAECCFARTQNFVGRGVVSVVMVVEPHDMLGVMVVEPCGSSHMTQVD